jgi:hypothetical protein
MVLNPGRDFESEQGSIPVEAIVDTGTGWRTPTRRGALFIFASYAAGRLVGISVGIGSNRRGKLLYIQMVIALVEYRPGAPTRLFKPVPKRPQPSAQCSETPEK